MLVIGSMISLGYYLRVIATMWMGGSIVGSIIGSTVGATVGATVGRAAPASGGLAPIAGGAPEADLPAGAAAAPAAAGPGIEITVVAAVFAAASVFFGIFPSPLFDLVAHAGNAIGGLL